jgi:heptosyltransferase-2
VTTPAFSLGSPLVVRSPNWLGDAVMALPAVRNLKNTLGTGTLCVAAPEKLAALWEACPFVDRVVSLAAPKSLWSTAGRLREEKFAAAVLLPNSLRSAAEAFLAGIPQRCGYARGGRGLLLTRTVPVPPRNPVRLHQRFYYLDLLAALGAPGDDTLPPLRANDKTTSAPVTGPLLAVCPGAEYGPAKRWPVGNFVAAARALAEKHGLRVVLLGAPNDAPVAAEFLAQFPEAENRVGQTSLVEFMAALASARLALCNDSGAMHLASALGVPTVAVFGSTEPQLTGPLGPRTAVLRHHVPCSPCFLRDCPIDFACMNSITPETVVAAAEKLAP